MNDWEILRENAKKSGIRVVNYEDTNTNARNILGGYKNKRKVREARGWNT